MSLSSLRSSQALTNAALAGSLAALIVWFTPPGTDFAAHVFQLHLYLRHGFAFWSTGALVAGSVVLGLMLPLLLILGQPDWGYLGMLLGYGLLWAGSRRLLRLLAAPPQLPVVA